MSNHESPANPANPLPRSVVSVLDSLPVGLLIASSADGSVQYANWAVASLFEQQPAALVGSSWPHARYVRHADGAPMPIEQLPLWRSLHTGETVGQLELSLELPSGTRREVFVSSAPLRNHRGHVTGALVVYRDASPLKAMQEALTHLSGELRSQHALVSAVLEQAPTPVAVMSYPESRFLLMNGAYRRVMAAAEEKDLLGARVEDIVEDARRSGMLDGVERAVRAGATHILPELRRATPMGEAYWNVTYTPLRNADGQIDRVLEMWQNVTTQVMAQRHLEEAVAERTRALEAQQHQLESLVVAGMSLSAERTQEGVLHRLSDVARELLRAREATLRMWGESGETSEFTATSAAEEGSEAPSARSISEALREVLGTAGAAYPRLAPEEAAARSLLQVPVICRGQVFGSLQVVEKSGDGEFSETDEVLAVGLAAQAAVAMENVRLLQDLEAQQERLVRAERLSTIGALAGGIAHDLRQPLNVLKLTVQLLRQSKTPRSEAEGRQLERLEQHVDQAARIIQDLLALAREEPPHVYPTDLNALVDQFVSSHPFPELIQIEREHDPDASEVPVDAGQISQVLSNLARNAVEAMSQKPGVLRFVVRRAAEWAEIEVRDEGIGIPPEQLSRVFEPLFTTRRQGTGLGLTLCQRIVTAHGGEIALESEEGRGTRVVVRLPLQ